VKWVARLLRRIASFLDPQVRRDPLPPIEFIPSQELADEIRRRNDTCVLFWGKITEADESWNIRGQSSWSIKSGQVEPLMEALTDRILSNERGCP
jgi:hypothetical protein